MRPSIDKILQRIDEWQNCPTTADLVCPLEKTNTRLQPVVIDDVVMMQCTSCGFTANVYERIYRDGSWEQAVS